MAIFSDQIDNGSVDGCGGPVALSIDRSSFTCDDLGPQTVTLTVTDQSNNAGTGLLL